MSAAAFARIKHHAPRNTGRGLTSWDVDNIVVTLSVIGAVTTSVMMALFIERHFPAPRYLILVVDPPGIPLDILEAA